MIKIAAVVGPTASGKTALSVTLAEKFSGEIVSADSMQIYKGMDIATAKPTEEEKRSIPHHMMDFLSPDVKYSVSDYVKDAKKCVSEIASRGKLPIVAGGTGLYVDSLLTNTDFGEMPDNSKIRKELQARLESEGNSAMLGELIKIDPECAKTLHENNAGRIIRALEVYYLTGVTMTELKRRSHLTPSEYDVCIIGINYKDRDVLYSRIDKRVDMMVNDGLIEEAKRYADLCPDTTSAQAIGYKELKPYFDGEITLECALDNLKRATRRYAKRQITWFKRNGNINWIYPDEDKDYINTAENIISEFLKKGGDSV